MHEVADKNPWRVVASSFNAFMFEVVKVYCHYPIKVLPGDKVKVLNGNSFCDFIIELPFSQAAQFKRDRIPEKDWWLFDLTLQREQPNGSIFLMVSSQFNEPPFNFLGALAEVPAPPNNSFKADK